MTVYVPAVLVFTVFPGFITPPGKEVQLYVYVPAGEGVAIISIGIPEQKFVQFKETVGSAIIVGVKFLVQVNVPIVCEIVIVGVKFPSFVNVDEKRLVFPLNVLAVSPVGRGVVTVQEIVVPKTEGFGKASKFN
jgi:hypothetical protein